MLNAIIALSGAGKIITRHMGWRSGFKRLNFGRLCLWGYIISGCISLIAGGLIIPVSQAHSATASVTTDHGASPVASDAGGHGAGPADAHPADGPTHVPTQGQTAGDLMHSDMATFDALSLVADVVADFKARQAHGELPATIYVVDSLGEFLGTLSTSRLLMAEPESVLDLLISGDPVSVSADSGVAEVLTAAETHNLAMIPVTDALGRLVGVVDAGKLPAEPKPPMAAISHSESMEPHAKAVESVDHGADHDTEHPSEDQSHAPSGEATETAAHPSETMMHAAAVTGHDAESHAAPTVVQPAAQPHAASADTAHGAGETHQNAASQTEEHAAAPHGTAETHEATAGHAETADDHGSAPQTTADHGGGDAHGDPHDAAPAEPKAKGVAFVEATTKPLSYELNDRFYGWRPNDIFDFSDNANNFQLGVLEVTRRTVVVLAERISRTGSIEAFDENVENAMNWLMIKSGRYWLPSPESKYQAAMDELSEYAQRLDIGEAGFYNRTDNLIPLLAAYEDLLGSCEENLVKHQEDDGSAVSFFKADDYFFYALGAASAMGTILSAIHQDFHDVLVARNGLEVLHHAVESCHHAVEINPWVITDSSYSGIFANHRANLAAPISHARFYLGVLIKTLST